MTTEAVQANLDSFLPVCTQNSNSKPLFKQESMFKHPLDKGWLVPYLAWIDAITTKRWNYWIKTVATGHILKEPIPKIEFSRTNPETVKMIEDCLKYVKGKGISDSLILFTDWLLWGFNCGLVKEFPNKISRDMSDYWYRKFNLGLVLKHPADYFMHFASIQKNGYGYECGRFGYFGTPPHIAAMMTEMSFSGTYPEEAKKQSVNDPCCGTGIFLLCASNYSLNLSGIDINSNMVKFATCNAYFYIPWLIKKLECKNALLN